MGKGQHNNSNGWGNSMKIMMKRGSGMKCSYGFMLLLGLGIAVFGGMVLHKLRERRIFDLTIKDKDQQLFSLYLLLEKERDYVKEIQQKTKEMRAKIYSLRTQKMNLDNRIQEMRSTISSMKDEQRTIQMALEEKQNEINQLTKTQLDYIKLIPLTDTLNQKLAETERIKQHIDQPVNVWSVSADGPSNSKVNISEAGESTEMAVKVVNNIDVSRNESSNNSEEKFNQGGDRTESKEHIQKLVHTSEESINNETSATNHRQREDKENSQVGGSSIDWNGGSTSNSAEGYKSSVEVLENSGETGNEKSRVKYKGGVKLQMADNEGLREKHTNRRKGKGKKVGIAKHGILENKERSEEIGVARIGGRHFGKGTLESEKKNISLVTRSMRYEGNTPVKDVQEKNIEKITSKNQNNSSDDQVEDGKTDKEAGHNEFEQNDYFEAEKSHQGKDAEEVPKFEG